VSVFVQSTLTQVNNMAPIFFNQYRDFQAFRTHTCFFQGSQEAVATHDVVILTHCQSKWWITITGAAPTQYRGSVY